MPPSPDIVVIVVDRLGSGWLGPYGCAWIPTPVLNRLAAESVLCEFMVSDSSQLIQVYRSYFSGVPAWRSFAPTQPPLPQLAREAGYDTRLVTDAEEVARHPLASGFEHIDLLTWKRPAVTAERVNQTRLGDVFATTSEAITSSDKPKLLWIHAAAMNAAWDAPRELREQMAAEDDPTPQDFVAPPSLMLKEGYDPDDLLAIVQAYAAEVLALDENLGALLAALELKCDPANTHLIFTSSRGYALGEHLKIGMPGDALHGEVLQVPLLLRCPSASAKLRRLGALYQPTDVYSVIAAAIRPAGSTHLGNIVHPMLLASAPGELGMRTQHWFYRQQGAGDDCVKQLYAKPDDRWEVNEVSQRATDITDAFHELAQWIGAHGGLPDSPVLPDLPEIIARTRC